MKKQVQHFEAATGFDFNVVKVDNTYFNPVAGCHQPTGLKSVVNDKTGIHLSTMGKEYSLFDNRKFEDFAKTVAEKLGTTVSHFTSKNGGATVIAGINRPAVEIAGFTTDRYLTVIDNRQGRKPLQVRTVTHMHRCDNIESAGSIFQKMLHNTSLPAMVEWFLSLLNQIEQDDNQVIENMNRFASVKIDAKVLQQLKEQLFASELAQERLGTLSTTAANKLLLFEESLQHENIFEGTLYHALAATTHFTSHNLNVSRDFDFRNLPIEGKAEKMNKIAYDFCMQLS